MSEPKRYSDLDVWKALHFGENDSGWVKWEDYARLKAEVEAVRQEYSDATNHYNRLHNDLQAQVERLTKAGDELWEFAKLADTNAHKARRKALKDWNAAKEGKQS